MVGFQPSRGATTGGELSETRSAVDVTFPAKAVPACLLAALVPGAGHLYLRRTSKGLVLLGCIASMFALGVVMDARLQVQLGMEDILASLFSVAQMAVGVPYVVAKALGYGADPSLVKSVTYEYGNTFTAVGGLLNILVVLDAYDTAVGRKG